MDGSEFQFIKESAFFVFAFPNAEMGIEYETASLCTISLIHGKLEEKRFYYALPLLQSHK